MWLKYWIDCSQLTKLLFPTQSLIKYDTFSSCWKFQQNFFSFPKNLTRARNCFLYSHEIFICFRTMPLSIWFQFDFNFRTIRFNHFDLEAYDIIWSCFCSLCCFLFIANNWLRVRFELDSSVRLVRLFLKMFYTQGCFVRKKAGKVSGCFT